MIDGSQQPSGVVRPPFEGRQLMRLSVKGATFSWSTAATIGLIVVANVLATNDFRFPFVGPAIGFWFIILLPVYLLSTSGLWRGCSAAERIGYSVAGVALLLMVSGLSVNIVLPLFGIQHPLDAIPVASLADVLVICLYLVRRRYPEQSVLSGQIRVLEAREGRLLVASLLCVGLAVMGANRLNNGAGDAISLTALIAMVTTLVLLLWWQAGVGEAVTSLTLYGISLGLLLMTSLRGWYVTGHDIQVEYRVFQLTEAHGHWSMSYFQDAYNACLSITILPTVISQVVHVDNPYVYKVFFQVLFAMVPVLVYTIARRYWTRPISVLAAIYFIGIPTFFTDMPFLNRQEMAFLFICVAILSITNVEWGLRRRQLAFLGAALGVELSHYSSMYFFLATLVMAWVAQVVLGLSVRRWRRRSDKSSISWGTTVRTIGLWLILAVVAIAFAWGQLVTNTAGSVVADARSAVAGFMGSNGTRSGDVSNFLFSGKALNLPTVWADYHQATFQQRAALTPSSYVPASVVDRYRTPLVSGLGPLPSTSLGHFLDKLGVSPAGVNTIVRNAAAKDEQLFAFVGFLAFLAIRRLRQHVGREVFCIGLGSMAMLAVIIVLPNLSIDYGVLRAFQEALIVVAPILVAGSLAAFSPFGHAWAFRISAAVCLAVFISTTGLLPELLGGYPAQLSLNNSGEYYDIYYTHPQEVAAVEWLGTEPAVLSEGVQGSFDPTRFAFSEQSNVVGDQTVTDIYPPLVKKASWLIVGYSTLHTRISTSFYDGDLISYIYPLGFLRSSKNLVYNNGGAEIFK